MAHRRDPRFEQLPDMAGEYIRSVARRVGNALRVRRDVVQELIGHFTDALGGPTDPAAREQASRRLIEDFGDPELLGVLIRRAKKRCRSPWKKAIVRLMQGVAALAAMWVLYTVYLCLGRPRISVDYLAVLNQQTRPKVPESQNAWPLYQRAMELYVPLGPDSDYEIVVQTEQDSPFLFMQVAPGTTELVKPTEESPWRIDLERMPAAWRQRLVAWLDANRPAWQSFVAASRMPYCWIEYQAPGDKGLLYTKLPPLNTLHNLTRMARWRQARSLVEGSSAQALGDAATVIRAGAHLQGRPNIVEQLVGLSLSHAGHESILEICARAPLTADQLRDAQAQAAAAYPQGFMMVNLEAEWLGFRDVVQRLYTDGGPNGGHLIPNRFVAFLESTRTEEAPPALRALIAMGSPMIAGRDETLKLGERWYQLEEKINALSPYQRRQQRLDEERVAIMEQIVRHPWRHPLLSTLLPSLTNAGKLAYHVKATHEATLTVLALQRYRLEHGQYPDGLTILLEGGYLSRLPMDPYSPGPLVYRRVDGDFILYSLGSDLTDNGGKSPDEFEPSKRREPWETPGADRVFWPLARPLRDRGADAR